MDGTIVPTKQLLFTFDESLNPEAVAPEKFKLYTASADQAPGLQKSSLQSSNTAVLIDFRAAQFANATTAAVEASAVSDPVVNGVGGTVNPEASVNLKDVTSGGGDTTAPDLVSVTNIVPSPTTGQATTHTIATFRFDEPVFTGDISALGDGGYSLILKTGEEITDCARFDTVATATTDHVVRCANPVGRTSIPPQDVARGAVQTGTVSPAEQNASLPGTEGETNPQQVATVTAGGVPGRPDLVGLAVDIATNSATYSFDENVTLPDRFPGNDAEAFRLYGPDGSEIRGVTATKTDNTQITVEFEDPPDQEVHPQTRGGSTDDGAVESTVTGRTSRTDETVTATTTAAGRTAAPDIEAITRATTGTGADQVVTVTYDFDSEVVLTQPTGQDLAGDFRVISAQGVRIAFSDASCALVANPPSQPTSDKVRCTASAAQRDAVAVAVLGVVAYNAVQDTDRTFSNYETGRKL